MTNDILQQKDLFDIANCRRKKALKKWLIANHISYLIDVKEDVIVHRKALEQSLGVQIQLSDDNVKLDLELIDD